MRGWKGGIGSYVEGKSPHLVGYKQLKCQSRIENVNTENVKLPVSNNTILADYLEGGMTDTLGIISRP